MGAFHHAAGNGENQRHGHVGCVFGEDARSVGDGDAALDGGGDVDIVDAIAEIRDQLQLWAGAGDEVPVDPVRHRGHEHLGLGHGGREFGGAHRRVRFIEPGLEQLAHAGLNDLGELARDDDERFFPHDS